MVKVTEVPRGFYGWIQFEPPAGLEFYSRAGAYFIIQHL